MDNIIDIPTSLHLSTGQISSSHTSTSVSNLIGGWDAGRQTFWFYVKMRNVLGNAYDKYDKFVISVVQVFMINSAANTLAVPLQLQMGGLNWVNSSYDQVSQANAYWAPVVYALQGTGVSGTSTFSFDILSNSFIFRKGDPDIKIDFRFMDILTNQLATVSSGLLPNTSVIFKIQPLKE